MWRIKETPVVGYLTLNLGISYGTSTRTTCQIQDACYIANLLHSNHIVNIEPLTSLLLIATRWLQRKSSKRLLRGNQ